jgi:hypothetical protein
MEYIDKLAKPSKILKMQGYSRRKNIRYVHSKGLHSGTKDIQRRLHKVLEQEQPAFIGKSRSLKEHQTNLNTVDGGDLEI